MANGDILEHPRGVLGGDSTSCAGGAIGRGTVAVEMELVCKRREGYQRLWGV